MSVRSAGSRLNRLEELKGLLKARDHVTAAELASDLGISLRTLHRDLETLREQGVPIRSDRGRGGGLSLERAWSLGRLHLSAEEAIDLLVSMAIAERMNSPLLLRTLASVRRKIVSAFSENYQAKIRALRRRILLGRPASPQVLASFTAPTRAVPGITEAFFNMRCVDITYVDEHGVVTRRDVEPQFLYLNVPVWYLLGWDRLRHGIRFFRVDRIRSAVPLNTTFRPADPKPYLLEAERDVQTV